MEEQVGILREEEVLPSSQDIVAAMQLQKKEHIQEKVNTIHGRVFTNTLMIDGAGYKWTSSKQSLEKMPSKTKGEFYASAYGNPEDGLARITLIEATKIVFPISDIKLSKGNLDKAFTPDNRTYYVELDSEDTSVNIELEMADINAIVKEGSDGEIVIHSGKHEHKIEVTGTDGTDYEYTIIFLRPASSYQYLKSIEIAGKEIDGFLPEKLNYTVELPYNADEITLIEGIKARPDQEIKGNDTYDISFVQKMIILDVKSEDKLTTTRYTIMVKKEDTTKLKACEIEKYDFGKNFQSDKYEYEYEVTTGVISLKFLTTPYNPECKVQVKGAGYIKEGKNPVTITVSKEGLEDTVYKITIIKGENLGEIAYDYDYTGDYQTFVAPAVGYYKFECWGAQGAGSAESGRGGYTSGTIKLNEGDTFYIYVGGKNVYGGWNGGGTSSYRYGGGGATDIRLVKGTWNDEEGLKSRVMVAGGGRRSLR